MSVISASNVFSIIVPVYNAAPYIERCLNSILNQTFDNFEIIVIDDGSTDSTPRLLQNYLGNMKVRMIRQENRGVSAARNRGISAATGRYLCFVDADDFLPGDALSHYARAITDDAAMITGASQHYRADGLKSGAPLFIGVNSNRRADEAINDVLYFTPRHGVCDKIFLARIVKSHGIEFSPGVANFEDLLFVITFLRAAENQRAISIGDVVYHYVESENSATRSPLNRAHFSFVTSFRKMKRYITRANARYYYFLYLKISAAYIARALVDGGVERRFIKQNIRIYRGVFQRYWRSGCLLNGWSAALLLFYLFPQRAALLREWMLKKHA